ncbi:pancreatic lipase-related protein 2-like, partial [Anneissia japonica]|uniref:pancreatic lipase-related protein 2-like n=1 Tax=Anneissia japonica TaxID=1529436 RepID=UPI00142552D0
MLHSRFFLTILSSVVLDIGVADEVCYGDLGCFNNDLQCHRLSFPPMAPDIMNVEFQLFTQMNPVKFAVIDRNVPESLTSTYFNPHLKTVVLIHGWTDTAGGWTNMVRDALLQR